MNENTLRFRAGLVLIIMCAVVSVVGAYLGVRAVDSMARAKPARPQRAMSGSEALARPEHSSGPQDWERRHITALLRGQGFTPQQADGITLRLMTRWGMAGSAGQ